MDETTDIIGHKASVICIGILDNTINNEIYLINMEFLKSTNSSSITQFFNQSITELYENDEIQYERIRLVVTDAAAYMKKACESIKGSYPDVIHVDCFAHNLHNLCNTIRLQYPMVDDYIACLKKILRKSSLRKEKFKMLNPTIPLPKYPSTTRWGSWLSCVQYLEQYNSRVIDFISGLDSKDARAIVHAKELILDDSVKNDIAFIETWFGRLIPLFAQLQVNGLTLKNSIKIVDKVKQILNECPNNEKTFFIKNKFDKLLTKNKGLATLMEINNNLNTGNRNQEFNYSQIDLSKFMYAPITSSEVERVFSLYKGIYTEKRTNLSEQNLKYILIIKYFGNKQSDK
eukprot:GAHX01001519.1.p1 GENE.GAHX01001519.1~~GAHX01001519.1.p1  ORF type:complete len:345 (-),score=49.59 GAHX01001519.1:26-1060(-)